MNSLYRCIFVAASLATSVSVIAAENYSVAEKRVFLDDHLKTIKHSETISYSLRQQGEKPEDTFEDKADIVINVGGGKKSAVISYLSGVHKVELPDVDDPKANPVILYFLEMDVRDMHRLIGGQEAYFRKRIRLALVDQAEVKPVMVKYEGHTVSASEVSITPYINDALKDRFGKFADKTYTFTISDKVPGGVYEIRTVVGDGNAAPVIKTVLSLNTVTG